MTQTDLFPNLPAAPRKLEDFGEKLDGARKDLWKDAAAPEATPTTLAAQLPEPDYQQAAANGTPWENLAAAKAIRDSFPARPVLPWKLEAWLDLADATRTILGVLLEGKADAADVIRRWPGDARDRFPLYLALGFPACLSARGWRVATGTTAAGQPATFAVFGEQIMHTAEGRGEEARTETILFIRGRLEAGAPNPAAAVSFSTYRNRMDGSVFIGKKAGREVLTLKAGFPTAAAAFAYLQTNRAELEAQWAALKDPALRRAANIPRRGPARRDGDATPDAFLQTFGLRGVQFGNWVENDRRLRDLNDAHDALTDLAAALGLPAAFIGFGGKLGLAFGARGTGKAMAHYERGQAVINLTKTGGPGCLAHEWVHALDNLAQPDPKAMATAAGVGAFGRLARVLAASPFADRSRTLDSIRGKAYYGKPEELAARAFEKYAVDLLAAAGASNDYLANLNTESRAYPTSEEMGNGISQAFGDLFAALKREAAGRA